MSRARNEDLLVRVWDPFVRLFHWALVTSFVVAWFTAHSMAAIHHLAGYAAGALVLLRLAWGLIGTRYARFGQFIRHPGTILGYLKAIATGSEARHIGHNPAGGAMIIVLILTMGATALTGWLTTTDQFWGVWWMQKLHDLLAHGLLLLIGLHLAGVMLASLRHRENLIGAMVTGMKRGPEPGDVD